MVLQDWFISTLVEPIYQEWLASALLRGDITFDISGKALPADKLPKFSVASRFQGRRWRWVDPAKELAAAKEGVALGIISRTRLAAEQGDDIDDIFDELTQEKTAMDAAGLLPVAPTIVSLDETPAAKQISAELRSKELSLEIARATPAPVTNFYAPPITVNTPEVRNEITVNPAAAPVTNITNEIHEREQPAPVINFNPTTNVSAPDVTVEVDAIMPAESEVRITALPDRQTISEVRRDISGNIVSSAQIETTIQ
jgi:hypothetical protein